MIRATAMSKDGKPVLILGLSHENLSRLVADEPIHFDTSEVSTPEAPLQPMHVIIAAGKTENEIIENMRHLVTPKTEFRLPGV